MGSQSLAIRPPRTRTHRTRRDRVKRMEVLTEVLAGRRSVASAAVLALDVRQVHRLLIRYREDGGGALIHKGGGQASNHGLNPGIRTCALELVRTTYADFGRTLATEVLFDKHGTKVGRETLRTWMVEDGLWLSRKQRPEQFHRQFNVNVLGPLLSTQQAVQLMGAEGGSIINIVRRRTHAGTAGLSLQCNQRCSRCAYNLPFT